MAIGASSRHLVVVSTTISYLQWFKTRLARDEEIVVLSWEVGQKLCHSLGPAQKPVTALSMAQSAEGLLRQSELPGQRQGSAILLGCSGLVALLLKQHP